MSSKTSSMIEIGFAVEIEEGEEYQTDSVFFPSKLGGFPSWLSYDPVPSSSILICKNCGKVCTFLLQIYAPSTVNKISGFHRSLFLFVCTNGDCSVENSSKNFILLRSQLSRDNSFYSYDPPDYDNPKSVKLTSQNYDLLSKLCFVCGILGDKQCSKCRSVRYCSREHQALHWKRGGHKQECCTEEKVTRNAKIFQNDLALFSEFILEVERSDKVSVKDLEMIDADDSSDDEENCDENAIDDDEIKKRIEDYGDIAEKSINKNTTEVGDELDDIGFTETPEQRQFRRFRKVLSADPDQVLRYHRNGKPLWITSNYQPSVNSVEDKHSNLQSDTTAETIPSSINQLTIADNTIPPCELCGACRTFEFQILPHLLSYLNVDSLEGKSLDWGTVAIYTCSEDCDIGTNYQKEFCWKQDIVMSKN